jgi:HSP20 family protein
MTRIYIERQDLPDEVRRLFDSLLDDGTLPCSTAAECSPAVDVVETDDGVEVSVDLPGVASDDVQVLFTRSVLLIAGQKLPRACDHSEAAFHLAERGFGRFARIVRLDGAYDGTRASATLTAGELRVVIPQIDDRRGREIRIPIRG